MSITEETGRYVIQSRANSLLGELSNDFSEMVIQLASVISTERTGKGVPVITVCDIAGASQLLCSAIENALKSGALPTEGESLLEKIKVFCDKAIAECNIDGGQSSRAGGHTATSDRDRA